MPLPPDTAAYAIVLEGSPRVPVLKAELQRIGLDQTVVFITRTPDTEDGVRGCMQSHQEALRRGLRARARSILVFEDDLEWHDRGWGGVHFALQAAVNATQTGNTDLAFLGGLPITPYSLSGSVGMCTATMMWTTAYVASAAAATRITAWPFRGIHIDRELLRLRQMQLVPAVAFQSTPRLFWNETLTTVQPHNPAYVFVNLAVWAVTRQGLQRMLEAFFLLTSPLQMLLFDHLVGWNVAWPRLGRNKSSNVIEKEWMPTSGGRVFALLISPVLVWIAALVERGLIRYVAVLIKLLLALLTSFGLACRLSNLADHPHAAISLVMLMLLVMSIAVKSVFGSSIPHVGIITGLVAILVGAGMGTSACLRLSVAV